MAIIVNNKRLQSSGFRSIGRAGIGGKNLIRFIYVCVTRHKSKTKTEMSERNSPTNDELVARLKDFSYGRRWDIYLL